MCKIVTEGRGRENGTHNRSPAFLKAEQEFLYFDYKKYKFPESIYKNNELS